MQSRLAPAVISFANWTPLGPDPITNAQNVIGPSPNGPEEAGAVNALAVDPLNAKHVYAATVNGGIWQAQDYTAARPVWTTTTDLMPSLAISAIAISPVSSQDIYGRRNGGRLRYGQ